MITNQMTNVISGLLTGPSWVEYRTRIDLLHQPVSDADVISARSRMLADPQVSQLIAELAGWPGVVLNSHKSARQHFHKLNFLADLGITAEDAGMPVVVEKILANQSDEGPFQLPTLVPEHFGGSGVETGAWALCDAPLILYATGKAGIGRRSACKERNRLSDFPGTGEWLALHRFEGVGQVQGTGAKG